MINRIIVVVLGVVIALMILSSTFYVVDQRRFAILFAFGEIKDVIREPGLHFKLPPPFQNVVFLDKRIQTIDTPEAERFITSEKRNVLVDTYVKWRIVDPRQYYISIGADTERAVIRMGQIVKAALNEEITKRTTHDVVSGEREQVMAAIKQKVAEEAKQIGVRDRRRAAEARRPAAGDQPTRSIAAWRPSGGASPTSCDRPVRPSPRRSRPMPTASARSSSPRRIATPSARRARATRSASAIYAQAFGSNPEFYAFYRSLDAYRRSFRGKSDVFVVDPSTRLLQVPAAIPTRRRAPRRAAPLTVGRRPSWGRRSSSRWVSC